MLNKVLIMGRLTSDPKIKEVTRKGEEASRKVAEFSIANNKGKKDNEVTTFLNCFAWDSLGETLAKFKHKGDLILVIGEIRQRKYENKDGAKVTAYEVVAREIEFDVGEAPKGKDNKPKDVDEDTPY